MGDTTISWTRPGTRGRTWNPTPGCPRVSEARWTDKVGLDAARLAEPLRWRQPSTVFVSSTSDLFHKALTNEQIAAVFGVMAARSRHTFIVLTKHARRMREWFTWLDDEIEEDACALSGADCAVSIHEARDQECMNLIAEAAADALCDGSEKDKDRWFIKIHNAIADAWARTSADGGTEWLMPNLWIGVSAENQDAADEGIPYLLKTPAAVRLLSLESLLGEIDLDQPRCDGRNCGPAEWGPADDEATPWCSRHDQERSYGHWLHLEGGIDWVVAGCESGPGARPCDVAWLRSLRDQCASADVPFFLKQAAALSDDEPDEDPREVGYGSGYQHPATVVAGAGSKRRPGGVIELPYLDGVQHAAFPEVKS